MRSTDERTDLLYQKKRYRKINSVTYPGVIKIQEERNFFFLAIQIEKTGQQKGGKSGWLQTSPWQYAKPVTP